MQDMVIRPLKDNLLQQKRIPLANLSETSDNRKKKHRNTTSRKCGAVRSANDSING